MQVGSEDGGERHILCPACEGQGGFERIVSHWPDYHGNPLTEWSVCSECDGQGEVIIVTSLTDWYDLDRPSAPMCADCFGDLSCFC